MVWVGFGGRGWVGVESLINTNISLKWSKRVKMGMEVKYDCW